MATTALQTNPQPVPIDSHPTKAQELTDVITHHSPRFRRIALSHLGNVADAEDAVQEALLSALRHIDQFRGQARMSTWVTAIVINSARMRLRERLVPVQLALEQDNGEQDFTLADLVSDTRPSPEEAYRNREFGETVVHATSQLSPALHKTFQLRDLNGLSIRETAHLMGVPPGTVKARLSRARRRLREATGKRLRRNGNSDLAECEGCGRNGRRTTRSRRPSGT